MYRTLRGWLGLLAVAAAVSFARGADEKAKAPAGEPKSADAAKAPAVRAADDLKVPKDAVLILLDDIQKGLRLMPRGVLLSPERYQELRQLEDEQNARRQAEDARPLGPSVCTLSGHVEPDLVRLQVQFKFTTARPRTLVTLGCQRAWARSAALDGKLPLFVSDPARGDALVVEVPAAGEHVLTIDLSLALVPRGPKGGDRGFDLGLPRAPITRLERLRLPEGVADIRINGRKTTPRPAGLEDVLLGAADRLEVFWRHPAPAASQGAPLLAADARVTVRLEEKRVLSDVELTLQVDRGQTDEWRVALPPQAAVTVKELGGDERLAGHELPTAQRPWLTLRLKRPSAVPLRVGLQVEQPRQGPRVPVGPFLVLGALRQQGTVGVVAPPEYRLHFQTHGEVSQRDVSEDLSRDNLVASFSYWRSATPSQPPTPPAALLDVEVRTVKGAIATRVEHTLQPVEDQWLLRTKIVVVPVRTGVDSLELQLPAGYPAEAAERAAPVGLVEEVVVDRKRQTAVVRLLQKQFTRFEVTLAAPYPLPEATRRLALDLPRPLQTVDDGGELTVTLPGGMELTGRDADGEDFPPGTRKHTWHYVRSPARAEVAWRPHRPELRVSALADVALEPRRAAVRQQFHLQFSPTTPARVQLVADAAVRGLHVLEGGTTAAEGWVEVEKRDDKATLVVGYTVAQAGRATDSLLALPLVKLAQATRTENKVRVWSDGGARVALAGDAWDELPAEAVPERDSLPLLVAHTSRADAPLALRLTGRPTATQAPIVVERALIQAVVGAGGQQTYRARFLLSRLGTATLDVGFAAPVIDLNLTALLDGKKLPRVRVLDGVGRDADNGTVLRLEVEPDLYRKPVLLDLTYQLGPERVAGAGRLQSVFYPPVPRGEVFLGRIRWQVGMPDGRVFLYRDEGFRAEQIWEWHGGFLTPRPAMTSADLEAWLAGPTGPAEPAALPGAESSLVCWRGNLEPLTVVHIPRPLWLVICSAVFLCPALGLCFAHLSRRTFLLTATLCGMAVLGAGVWWPDVVPAVVYGCEPGAAVLALILVGYWFLHTHHRRRLHVLPAFSRGKPGSSLLQPGSSQRETLRPRVEPSTVDAPVMRGSSVTKQQQVQGP